MNELGTQPSSPVVKPNTDPYGRVLLSERDVCARLYVDPSLDVSRITLKDSTVYNAAIEKLYLDWDPLQQLDDISESPAEWHRRNQQIWLMPEEYRDMDIARWILGQCADENELQRCGQELLLFAERDCIDLLKYLKYLVDTMRNNNIVWGVGRGSSVASFVLYIIGVHRIHSLRHNLDIAEFLR
jgi:Bacterial DNA polymerase III alpha NTPase domain